MSSDLVSRLVRHGILAVDRAGTTIHIDHAMARLVGVARDEVVGRPLLELVDDAWHGAIEARMERVFAQGRGSDGSDASFEIGLRGGAGGPVFARMRATGTRDAEGRCDGAVLVVEDACAAVTRARDAELLASHKLDAIGRTASGIAHDVNNAITAILNCVRLLDRKLGERGRRELELIRDGSQRAARLTRPLLSLASDDGEGPSVVGLGEIIAGVEALVRRLAGERIEVSTPAAVDGPRARIDRRRLEQAIIELVVNARDAMPGGGRLTVTSRSVELTTPRAGVDSIIERGEYAVLTVADTGGGMEPAIAERACEPFFSSRRAADRRGLGLAAVRSTVADAGGHLELTTMVGAGTRISLYLPLARDEAAAGATPAAASLGRAAHGETLLLVEDEALVRVVLAEALEHSGYHVLTAQCYADAVSIAEAHDGAIDLLVTDVVMPRGTGTDLAAQLLERRPRTAVLFISGYSRQRVIPRHFGPGVAFLAKPFTPERLAAKVREVLDDRD